MLQLHCTGVRDSVFGTLNRQTFDFNKLSVVKANSKNDIIIYMIIFSVFSGGPIKYFTTIWIPPCTHRTLT